MKVLVVARYQEDISWLKLIDFPSIVYNKFHAEAKRLPNIGRETNTYLFHILRNYHDLPAVTLFCQGDPFAHSNDFVTAANSLPETFTGFHDFGHSRVIDDDIGMHSPRAVGIRNGFFYQQFFDRPSPGTFHFGAGAQFAVSRDRIRARPIDFYLRLYELTLDEDPAYEFGHVAERLWGYFFSPVETHSGIMN